MFKIDPKYLKLLIIIKVIKVTVLVYFGFFSLRSDAVVTFTDTPIVDIVWNCPGSMSELEKQNLKRLKRSFQENIFPKIPKRIWNDLAKNPLYKIELTRSLTSVTQTELNPGSVGPDALFLPAKISYDSTGRPEVTLKMRCELINVADSERLFAHELFHSLHYLIHPDEPAWLREGLAQLFETLIFRGLHSNAKEAFENIHTKLESDFEHSEEKVIISKAQYGHSLLYFYYLYKNCGYTSLFWALTESADGLFERDTIDYALQKMEPFFKNKPQCKDFSDSSTYFEIARVQNKLIQTDEYIKSNNQNIFAVAPHDQVTLAPAIERKLTPQEIENLNNHIPYVVSFEWFIKNKKFLSFDTKAYYLEDEFPHRVFEHPSTPLTNTSRVLLYKPVSP